MAAEFLRAASILAQNVDTSLNTSQIVVGSRTGSVRKKLKIFK
jgi:hypothetical protein